ncbi:MAG: alkaline phosphatase family protein [Solirubrobacteraceae bacterium]
MASEARAETEAAKRSRAFRRLVRADFVARGVTYGVIGALALTLASCGSANRAGPVQKRPSPKAKLAQGGPAHIAVVVLENAEYSDVVGSRAAPFINGLARRYGLATQMYAISHPSLPNYLALTGGSTFGIGSDCTDCSAPGAGLAGQLGSHGISWKAYMEDLPRPCFTGASAGDYAKRHNPFVYYRRLVARRADCERVVPLEQLSADERAHALPKFIWITPNLCHDMHDCGLSTADHFLARLLPPLLARLGHDGLVFLTWDEGTSDDGCCRLAAGGHIATIVAGPGARRHVRFATPVDHYSLLQTIEDLFGMRRLRGAACACTPSLSPLLATGS